MSNEKDNQEKYYNEQGEDAPEILDDVLEAQQDDSDEAATEEMVGEVNLAEQLTAAREEIEKEKKEYLFLMADFDNFRKRVVREKADLIKNAGEKVLKGILPIVDDFERALAATSDTESMRQGMELIYNKLVKYLADNGVKPMESTGAEFNADFHEAIASIPAPSDDLKGKVIDTTQKGYMINDKVLRHAKVAVGE